MDSIMTSPKGSGEIDRKNQGPRLAEKFALFGLVDFADELDQRMIEHRLRLRSRNIRCPTLSTFAAMRSF